MARFFQIWSASVGNGELARGCESIGSLNNDDGDGNENAKKVNKVNRFD